MSGPTFLAEARTWARSRWQALQPRERAGLACAAGLLGFYVLWSVAVAPALRTLSKAPAVQAQQEAQLERMRLLATQAQALRSLPRSERPAAWREALTASVRGLGASQLQWSGSAATVAVLACPPEALGPWLAELGPRWQLQVSEARLVRDAQGLWQGEIVLEQP